MRVSQVRPHQDGQVLWAGSKLIKSPLLSDQDYSPSGLFLLFCALEAKNKIQALEFSFFVLSKEQPV